MAHPGGRPPIISSLDQLTSRIDTWKRKHTDVNGNYIYDDPNKAPTMSGLALELGYCDRHSLYDVEQRDPEFYAPIKGALAFIAQYHERACSTRTTPVGNIFLLKNLGYSDKQEVELSGRVDQGIVRLPAKRVDTTGGS